MNAFAVDYMHETYVHRSVWNCHFTFIINHLTGKVNMAPYTMEYEYVPLFNQPIKLIFR